MTTSVEDIAYDSQYGRQILPDARVWCLLKLKYRDPECGSEWMTAQWDPVFRGGSWILCNPSRTVIELDHEGQKDVAFFTVLGP